MMVFCRKVEFYYDTGGCASAVSLLDFDRLVYVPAVAAIVNNDPQNPDVDTEEKHRCKEETWHEG
jgi:hypothetical protein